MASESQHRITILGGNFAGLGTSHYLLKHTIPALSKLQPSIKYTVTLVSPSTHSFFKISTPRVLASPDLIPLSKVFIPIPHGFKDYSEQFNFVQGTATEVNTEQKTITVSTPNGITTVLYSTLVIATGTSAKTPLWTLNGSHDLTTDALKTMQTSLPMARTILIAGGGPVGTETAGEIASLYPDAKITILSGGARLLPHQTPDFSRDCESRLAQKGVGVTHNLRVISVKEEKTTELALSDATTRVVDVYIDCTGGQPNTSFLPASWLDERGFVLNDEKTLRLTSPDTQHVYAIGDVGSYSKGVVLDVIDAIRPLCSSIHIDLLPRDVQDKSIDMSKESSGLLAYLWSFFVSDSSPIPKQRFFKHTNYHAVPIGPKGGVGQFMGYRIPSLMVWLIKARTFMVEKAEDAVSGKDYLAA